MSEKLNPQQERAVTHTKGSVAIIAGAGTGKTCVIIEKIAHLLKNGITPESILALTFSRKAAGEMLERVNEKLGKSTGMHISTFHSFCYDIVRENPSKFNLPHDVNVLEEIDQAVLFHQRFSINLSNSLFAIFVHLFVMGHISDNSFISELKFVYPSILAGYPNIVSAL